MTVPTLVNFKHKAPQAGAALKAGHRCHVQMPAGIQDEVCDMGWQLLHSAEVLQGKAHGLELPQPHECLPKPHGLRGVPVQVQKSQLRKTLAAHVTKCKRQSHLRTSNQVEDAWHTLRA